MKIGELLKTARVGRHLTQSDLEARGKGPDRCHQWEEGNTAGLDGNGAAFEDTGVERRHKWNEDNHNTSIIAHEKHVRAKV